MSPNSCPVLDANWQCPTQARLPELLVPGKLLPPENNTIRCIRAPHDWWETAAFPALKRNLLNPPTELPEPAVIEAPAGKFTTTVCESRIGGEVAHTCYSAELPGMVLYEAAAGGMELTAYGSDGTSALSGDIVPYTPLPEGVKPGGSRTQINKLP